MGCGVSKFNKDELAGTSYLYYNPVHRQTDDLGPWRHKADRAVTVDLASTKQPLILEDADSATNKGATRNDPSNVDGCVMKLPPMPQQMMKAEGSEVAVAGKEDEGKARGSGGDDDTNGKEAKANEEDHETRSSNKESSIFYPGSPSFREYCFSSNNTSADADSSSSNNNNVGVLNGYVSDDDRGELDKYHQRRDSFTFKTAKEEGIPPSPDFIEKPDEPERTQLEEKKGRRRSRRFRVGLPRNSSAGVRSIWHVTSCSPQRTTAGKAAS